MTKAMTKERGGKHRLALLTWIGVYPVLTVIALGLYPLLSPLPIPLQTLIMSAIMVPIMVYAVMPLITYFSDPGKSTLSR